MINQELVTGNSAKRLRIAFIIDTFPVISQTFILDQIVGLIDLGHEVDIYAFGSVALPHHADVARYNLLERTQFLGRPAAKTKRMANLIFQILQTAGRYPSVLFKALREGCNWRQLETGLKILKRLKRLGRDGAYYDVIHCHFGTVGWLFLLLKYVLPASYITSFHGFDLLYFGKKGKQAYRRMFIFSDSIIANSDFTRKKLSELGCPEDKIVTIPVGMRMDKYPFRPRILKPGNTINLLTVARLVEVKGLEYSIMAVAKLVPRYHLQYRIVGEGQLRPNLENLIFKLSLSGTVSLLGEISREELAEQMDKAHLFILPSVTSKNEGQETAGSSLREAMASGIPVVATNSGGIRESVTDGVSGYLVPERNADAIAERLEFLFNHPDIWPEMGGAGNRFVEEQFEFKKQIEKLAGVYRKLREQQ
jgi:colanic acid/amylovoran biosynthesis glycosyltransferase